MKKIFIILSLLFSITITSANAVEVTVEAKITGLYVAYFNRAADQEGLNYWTAKADEIIQQGGDVSSVFKKLSAGFATHPTFKSTYNHLNNEEFVSLIYRNALGRDGDAEGIAYWTKKLDNEGMIRSDMVSDFVELSLETDLTPENYPNLTTEELAAGQLRQDLITNKATAALAFTHQLGVLSNVEDSQDPEQDPAYVASIKIISEVTEEPETVSGTLSFLESIKESDDPIRDILEVGTIVATALSVSHNKAIPGTFITIKDSSIKRGTDINVTFSNSSGYSVVLNTLLTENGSAKVTVPPYLNKGTNTFEENNVTISISNNKRVAFQIEALPELKDIEAGFVVKTYLQSIVNNLNDALIDYDNFGVKYDHDVEGIKTQIQIQIDEINSILNELNTHGTYKFTSLTSGTSTLTQDDLKKVDQLLYSMMIGLHNETQAISSQGKITPSLYLKTAGDDTIRNIADGITSVGKTSEKGIMSFTGNMKTIAEYFGGDVADNAIALYDVFEGAGRVIAIGMINEIANIVRSQAGDIYEPGHGVMDQVNVVLDDYIKSNTPEWAEAIYTGVKKLIKARKAYIKKLCQQEPLPNGLSATCSAWDVYPETYVSFSRAHFGSGWVPTSEVTSGKPVNFFYFITGSQGHKHAKVSTVTIDWGDGNISSPLIHNSGYPNQSAFGPHITKHTYFLTSNLHKTYTAKITVTGDNDPEKTHAHTITRTILVKNAEPLNVSFVEGDKTLNINERGTWKVEITGGVPPFDMDLAWEGFNMNGPNLLHRKNSHIRKYKMNHSYKEERVNVISFFVKDANGDTVSADYDVIVGEGEDSDYLELDRVEFYAYNNQCGKKAACYEYKYEGWESGETNYNITNGGAFFSYLAENPYKTLSLLTMKFAFEPPPKIIKTGSEIPLSISGKMSGFTTGMFLSRGIWYYTQTSDTARADVIRKGSVKFYNRDLDYNEDTGVFSGDDEDSNTTIVKIPENAKAGFIIGVKHGWDPGMYIYWVYKSYGSE